MASDPFDLNIRVTGPGGGRSATPDTRRIPTLTCRSICTCSCRVTCLCGFTQGCSFASPEDAQ